MRPQPCSINTSNNGVMEECYSLMDAQFLRWSQLLATIVTASESVLDKRKAERCRQDQSDGSGLPIPTTHHDYPDVAD